MITLANNSGFCPGVKRADIVLRKTIADNPDKTIYTLGPLIHNQKYTDELARIGIEAITINKLEEILSCSAKDIILVGRTHGITKEEEEKIKLMMKENKNLSFIDLTCSFVKSVHKVAEEETDDTTLFLLYADKGHPEAVATLSRAKGEKYIFSSVEELESIDFSEKRVIFAAQTTQNSYNFKKIEIFSKKLYTNAIFFDTICNVTEKRQEEAINLAKNSDAVIVIGGKHSANSKKLYELCCLHCDNVYFVEDLDELRPFLPIYANRIGITAGASTPGGIIMEVIKAMERENDFSLMLEDSLKTLHTGETVTGTIVTIGKNEIKLDLGTKFTGVLDREQITDDPSVNLADMFKIGDEIDVFVIRVEDGKGIATVSKKRVDADNSWVVLRDAHEAGEILEGKVTSVVKGGVIVNVASNNVFVPSSQTGVARGGDLKALVGTTQRIKLLEFDVTKKRALGSIKAVLVEEKRAKEDAIWATLVVGNSYTGVVKNLTAYGAFVDIGGVDGMVHNTELSYKKIKHPSQVVSIGQEIVVYIKELDVENRRISLGYKTEEMDTWLQFTKKFNVGDVVSAKIVSIMPFGAFAEVYEDVDGLIHISRISTERINSPADVLTVGQVVDVKITEIDNENRRLALSMRALIEEAQRAEREAAEAAARAEREAEAAAEAAREAEERADMAPYIVGSID